MSGPGPVLRRHLSLRDLVVYGLLFIGPLAPVGVFGVLSARTDGAVALVYLVATAAMALTAWSYAAMSRAVPEAGAVFAYARAGLGEAAGFLAGWLAMLDYLLIPSVACLFSGIALHALVPTVPAWVFTAVAFGVSTTANLSGVRQAARVGILVLGAELAVLAAFVLFAVAALGTRGPVQPVWSPWLGTGDGAWTGLPAGVSVAVLSYLGFDAIAGFAEEVTGDRREVGRAIAVCLATAGVLFVTQVWLAGVLSPLTPEALAAHPEGQGTAFYDMVRVTLGGGMTTLLALTKAIGPAFAAMAAQAASARLLFGMARDGHLPAALATVDVRTGVPSAALLASGAVTLVVSLWAARRPDGLEVLVSVVDIGALAAFALLHAAVLGYFRCQHDGRWSLPHAVVPLAGIAVVAWVLVGASSLAHLVGALWLATGVVVLAVRRRQRRESGGIAGL